MQNIFDTWNEKKKYLSSKAQERFVHSREIWWCSLGINIGSEINGKNDNFERPVLVIKVYNKETALILPITSKEKSDQFHFKAISGQNPVWIKLTQVRVISLRRMLRKITTMPQEEFGLVKKALFLSL